MNNNCLHPETSGADGSCDLQSFVMTCESYQRFIPFLRQGSSVKLPTHGGQYHV